MVSSKTLKDIEDSQEVYSLKVVEAVLFVSGKFISLQEIVSLTDLNPIIIREVIEKLKKKYKNAQKLQEETMKMYKEKNVNPMGGCLPTLIQLPVFIVLWQTIQYFGEAFAYNPRFLLWTDLSEGGFGTNFIFILISLGAYLAIALLSAQNSKMAWQQIAMSTIFPLLLSGLPAGVFLYYTSNALIQLIITFYNNKRNGVKGIGFRELFGLGPKPVRR